MVKTAIVNRKHVESSFGFENGQWIIVSSGEKIHAYNPTTWLKHLPAVVAQPD